MQVYQPETVPKNFKIVDEENLLTFMQRQDEKHHFRLTGASVVGLINSLYIHSASMPSG